MCGRFALNEEPRKLAEHFDLTGELDFSPSWNIAPSARICTIIADSEGGRRMHKMRWGLIPAWAKDAMIGNKLANARGETVAEKPSFRSAFKYHRCIIPASGFFEWKTVQGVKQPWYISLKSGKPMMIAGLWETWHDKDASIHLAAQGTQHERRSDEVAITSCCIITTDANALMQPIHDRMPVILDREQWSAWLSPQEHRADQLLPLIRPHIAETMQAWPVTRDLNRAGLRDDAGLVERVG